MSVKVYAPHLAYESYFGCRPEHALYPATRFPAASSMYRHARSANP